MKRLAVVAVLFAVAITLAGCPAVSGAISNIPPVKVGDHVIISTLAPSGTSRLDVTGDVNAINGAWVQIDHEGYSDWVNLSNSAKVTIYDPESR